MAFVAMVALGIIIHVSGGLQAVWNSANATMAAHGQPAGQPAGGDTADRTAH